MRNPNVKTAVPHIIILSLMQPVSAQEDDFWLMMDSETAARSSLYVNAGVAAEDGHYYGVATSLALSEAQFYLSANQQNFEIDTSQWSLGLGTNPFNKFSVRIDTAWTENNDILATTDVYIDTAYQSGKWRYILGYQAGEVEISVQTLLRRQSTSVFVDRTAWHYGIGYAGNLGYWQIEQRSFDYAEDISAIPDSTSLQDIRQAQAFSQATTLADQQTGLRLGTGSKKYAAEIAYNRIRYAIDLTTSDYLTVILSREMSEGFSLSLQWDEPLDEGVTTAGLIAGWWW
jgi:hypothetical protein